MSSTDVPPVISPAAPPVMPPPLPTAVAQPSPGQYIARCKVICIVATSLFVVGLGGFAIKYIEEGTANWGAFAFALCYVFTGYGAAVLLHRKRPEGYLPAALCLGVVLLLIPVGTVFGVLGLIWLNKGRPCLKKS